MMIEYGAPACFMKDKKGYLPAHVACSRHCSPEKLRLLLAVNPYALFAETNYGNTLLDLAKKEATKSHPNNALIKELTCQVAMLKKQTWAHRAGFAYQNTTTRGQPSLGPPYQLQHQSIPFYGAPMSARAVHFSALTTTNRSSRQGSDDGIMGDTLPAAELLLNFYRHEHSNNAPRFEMNQAMSLPSFAGGGTTNVNNGVFNQPPPPLPYFHHPFHYQQDQPTQIVDI